MIPDVADDAPLAAVLAAYLDDADSGFSIGSLGAMAEFFRNPDEPTTVPQGPLSRLTSRGAIRIDLADGAVPVAYETVSARPGGWQHGVYVCLPEATGFGPARRSVTELGPDAGAIDAARHGDVLFDLGIGARNVSFCVRTADADLIDLLRGCCGQPIFAAGLAVMDALIEASPHRVVVSALGRIEVYQRIDRVKSPEGPHTHLLSKLIRTGCTHSANVALPPRCMPCLALHPASPLSDALGQARPFDPARFAAFQRLLARWGLPEFVAEKARLRAALAAGLQPAEYAEATSRLGRAATRIALRQQGVQAPKRERAILASWVDYRPKLSSVRIIRNNGLASGSACGYEGGAAAC